VLLTWRSPLTPLKKGGKFEEEYSYDVLVNLEIPPSPPINKSLSPYSSPLKGENSLGWGENLLKVPREIKGVASSGFPLFKGDGRGISLGDLGGSPPTSTKPIKFENTPSPTQHLAWH